MATLTNAILPYSALESWSYDKIVAPVLSQVFSEFFKEEVLSKIPQGGRVLDVGCGGGHIVMLLAAWRPDISVIGVDLSSEQIKRASGRAKQHEKRITFKEGNVVKLPFESEFFDFVLSVGSIKHWPDQLTGINECFRVLKPGQHLIIVETDRGCHYQDLNNYINFWNIPKLIKPLAKMLFRTYVAGQSLDLIDGQELVQKLENKTCSVERIGSIGGLVFRGQKI